MVHSEQCVSVSFVIQPSWLESTDNFIQQPLSKICPLYEFRLHKHVDVVVPENCVPEYCIAVVNAFDETVYKMIVPEPIV